MHDEATSPGDAEIVRRVLEGDANAFELLLKRHQQHVLRIVKKHVPHNDVEETAQDVFVRAYRSLPTFKGKSGFRQWVSSIAVRACCDFWRKAYRSREIPMSCLTERHQRWLEEVVLGRSAGPDPDRDARKEARELLDWALGKLSAKDRMVLELIYLEGLSGKEAAGLLGWSVANVKVRSLRCRRKLQKVLERARNR